MNREHWKAMLPVITAFAEGKAVQTNCIGSNWINSQDELRFDDHPENYRIKPEPKWRPWKEGEIPIGAVWRVLTTCRVLYPKWQNLGYVNFDDVSVGLSQLYQNYEHSLDNGKNWHACGVMEGGE